MGCRLLILPCFILLFSCNHREKVTPKVAKVPIDIPHKPKFESIEEAEPSKDFSSFWDYYARHIKLNEDFIAYDKHHKQISKVRFLETLTTGKYQPILINPTDTIRYELKSSPKGTEVSISDYMRQYVAEALVFYHMEGKPVPNFSFKTLAGDRYTSKNTLGKLVLFKCWFIGCVTCVQEMPELNELVESYSGRKDIVFISLAIDNEAPLRSFLNKTKFDYQTVARQGSYMTNKLKVSGYPTHFLVDRSGNVVKVSNSAGEIETFLERTLSKDHGQLN
jgi:thiol-disulfide isomerase/thioredoxin